MSVLESIDVNPEHDHVTVADGAVTVAWVPAGDARWEAVEAALAGAPLAMDGRASWVKSQPGRVTRLLAVRDGAGAWMGAASLDVTKSRVLPGHVVLRARRFGHGLPREAWRPAIVALKREAMGGRTLRLHVEVFSPDHRAEIGRLLEAEGFRRAEPSSYRHTLTMDLVPAAAELLSTRASLRKRLREVEKVGAAVRMLGPVYAERLVALQQQAMARSGGSFRIQDWPRVLAYSESYPQYSRVVGLFLSADAMQPEDLIGFAWGCMHGDHAEYRAAGTAQLATRVPISYPLLWDLVLWARGEGATWFDLGGVTVAATTEAGDGDPLAGISEFKGNFSKVLVEVGEEWMLEPSAAKAAVASTLGRVVEAVRAKLRAGA